MFFMESFVNLKVFRIKIDKNFPDFFNCSMGSKSYFTQKDDFFKIIQQHLPSVVSDSIEYIKTGWTNVVICASDSKDSYFFRFPRNTFFAKMMLKDHAFCSFMRDKVSFQFPNITILYDEGRPFSMHKKIQGWTLTERFKFLSRQAMTNLAFDIATFIRELSQVDSKSLPKTCNMPVSEFLDQLSTVDDNGYDLSRHNVLKALENKTQVVHGDLNPGNILLDENDRMVGVIDFAFAGTSNNYVDLSRIIGRSDKSFEKHMIEAYEQVMHERVDLNQVKEVIHMWDYVEQQYILYIQQNHPEIQLPEKCGIQS